ncbi:hypothetical protein [Serratia entomophila]|uniref:hypothetical protein n=1 Tax=Serratia entomophila TaxID=42906 RepID=UPI00217A7F3F|nr:hypothetical protein [Serratia entomophila]CAI1050566.1 Uncharacterised protein [Serratia entomophila]CAI1079362.1 Uncharacterised protein [Serratia entomophila]CAI1089527.1 Uncharacterised protein [Serratia entomophila]CAI1092786.1 Uncharacterised protein [Serratia entomophila]CAI1869187.1 Uncharacterised protein [Serratia entomophila]
MIDKGQMLSRHDFSKVNWGILAAAALLLTAGAALLMLPLLSNMDENAVLTLLQTGAATILLGCTLLALRHYLRPAQTYRLYEHGVRVFNDRSHKERFIPFEKIDDIYRFRSGRWFGGLLDVTAFRTGADQPWCTVFSNVAHSWRLADTIIDQQIRQRGPLALNALYRGEVVSFNCLGCGARWLWRLLLGQRQGARTETLRLSATLLSTPQGAIPIEQIRTLEKHPQHGAIRLLDSQGNALFTIDYYSLLSADLFVALLEHMIYNRIPAYQNPAMTRQQL